MSTVSIVDFCIDVRIYSFQLENCKPDYLNSGTRGMEMVSWPGELVMMPRYPAKPLNECMEYLETLAGIWFIIKREG